MLSELQAAVARNAALVERLTPEQREEPRHISPETHWPLVAAAVNLVANGEKDEFVQAAIAALNNRSDALEAFLSA